MFGGRDVSDVASCSGVLSWLEDRDDEMGDGRWARECGKIGRWKECKGKRSDVYSGLVVV